MQRILSDNEQLDKVSRNLKEKIVIVEHLAILAPGLLGASVARAAKARGLAGKITIWARRSEIRHAISQQTWCDSVADSPENAVKEADLVILATPVEKIIELLPIIAPHIKAGSIVTDVGSVKGDIARHGRMTINSTGGIFIGSHPMAGSEKTGWEHGTETFFERKICFLTPDSDVPPDKADLLTRFWIELGSEVVTVSPDEHDEIVANISHLPQAVATSLAVTLSARPGQWRYYAGGGLKDTTRIAGSDSVMWIEILQQNRDEILRALGTFQDELQAFHSALANKDWFELKARLERGKTWRDGFRP